MKNVVEYNFAVNFHFELDLLEIILKISLVCPDNTMSYSFMPLVPVIPVENNSSPFSSIAFNKSALL